MLQIDQSKKALPLFLLLCLGTTALQATTLTTKEIKKQLKESVATLKATQALHEDQLKAIQYLQENGKAQHLPPLVNIIASNDGVQILLQAIIAVGTIGARVRKKRGPYRFGFVHRWIKTWYTHKKLQPPTQAIMAIMKKHASQETMKTYGSMALLQLQHPICIPFLIELLKKDPTNSSNQRLLLNAIETLDRLHETSKVTHQLHEIIKNKEAQKIVRQKAIFALRNTNKPAIMQTLQRIIKEDDHDVQYIAALLLLKHKKASVRKQAKQVILASNQQNTYTPPRKSKKTQPLPTTNPRQKIKSRPINQALMHLLTHHNKKSISYKLGWFGYLFVGYDEGALRRLAAQKLQEIGSIQTLPTLITAMIHDKNPTVKQQCATAYTAIIYGAIKRYKLALQQKDNLKEHSLHLRNIYHLLIEPKNLIQLTNGLRQRNKYVKIQTAGIIRMISELAAIQGVHETLEIILKHLRSKNPVRYLVSMLWHRNQDVATQAAVTLNKLSTSANIALIPKIIKDIRHHKSNPLMLYAIGDFEELLDQLRKRLKNKRAKQSQYIDVLYTLHNLLHAADKYFEKASYQKLIKACTNTEIVHAIETKADHSSRQVRKAAVLALRSLPTQEASAILQSLAQFDQAKEVCITAIHALVKRPTKAVATLLQTIANQSKDTKVILAALEVLGNLPLNDQGQQQLELLDPFFYKTNWKIRQQAVQALFKIARRTQQETIRTKVVNRLANIKEEDANETVSNEAEEAYETLFSL